jgi:glycine betaine/proline transport system substrate-binding protein
MAGSIARRRLGRGGAVAAALVAGALVLTACGGGAKVGGSSGGSSSGGGGAAKACGTVNLADNAWVGYEADLAVVSYVLKNKLKCAVTVKHINEQVSWQGFASGQVDAILENWGHDDLKKKFIDQQKVAQDAGSTSLKGIIGWYVPPWMATKYPDITDWKNLNKYASMFKTSESGGKGQLLDGDPSYVTNDAALVKNLNLNFKVVQGGSEAALITSFRQAEANKKPLLAYFYEPQWLFAEVDLKKVALPPYKDGCQDVPAKVACDYPETTLKKVASTSWVKKGSPAVDLVKNFKWTNDDQNEVAKYIAKDGMSSEEAAAKWVEDNPDKVDAWLS